MVSDPRPRNDWSRQLDSVFRPRTNLPGSKRGRFLVVFALFLLGETAFTVSLWRAGESAGIGTLLWAVWLAVCVLWTFVPSFGAANDSPGHQRVARLVGFWTLLAGLVFSAAAALSGLALPRWSPIVAASVAVGAAAGVLGVLEWRTAD